MISLNKFLLGGSTLEESGMARADVSGNGECDTTDSLMILKYIVEITPNLQY